MVGKAEYTHENTSSGGHLYYIKIDNRSPPPYKRQRRVEAIIDIAEDGTLAGIELIDRMPPPPPKDHLETKGDHNVE